MKLLVSVRHVDEALLAARGGAHFIDLKEPGAGALGALPLATIRAIVAGLREQGIAVPLSATIGDVSMSASAEIGARVDAVAACGVTFVKVGIEAVPAARAVLDALARCGKPVIPVFIADRGLDWALVDQAASLHFPALMVDTADKLAGSLFDVATPEALRRFIGIARGVLAHGKAGSSGGSGLDAARAPHTEPASGHAMAGLAGALRIEHAAALAALAPDFAGFRSAVCAGTRGSALDPQRLRLLVQALRPPQPPATRASPSNSARMRASSVR